MQSADGRHIVVFNGEIYNSPMLRRELEEQGRIFRTTSDTEVILQLFAVSGPSMVDRLRGMFALAIWDAKDRSLFLARDPYGIKPLYTSNDGWNFRFASQVKALVHGGHVSTEPEPAGVVGFHLWGSVPDPWTLYREVRALPAGHTQLVDESGPRYPRRYASIARVLADGARSTAPPGEVLERVEAAALDSVRAHLLADVEVGIFLSAGVDSGALLGLMRDAGQRRIRAITLAFDEFRGTQEDETALAAAVCRHYGAEHVVRTVSRAEFEADLPQLLQAMDQPSIDGVNTWMVAKAAHEAGLKVALSGVGGDELLAGYPSFREIPAIVRLLAILTAIPGLGRAARLALSGAGIGKWRPKLPGLVQYGGTYPGAYLLRRALMLPFELKTVLDPEFLRQGMERLDPLQTLQDTMAPDPGSANGRITALESEQYLRNQLLRDVDWAGMAHSLEIRTPLVDFTLLRAMSSVIPRFGLGLGKAALAKAPSRSLPESVVRRPKTGFGVPVGEWLGGPSMRSSSTKGAESRVWAREVLRRSQLPREMAMACGF